MDIKTVIDSIDPRLLMEMPIEDMATTREVSTLLAQNFPAGACFEIGAAYGIAWERKRRAAEEIAKLKEMLG